jgi:hypothetical protein
LFVPLLFLGAASARGRDKTVAPAQDTSQSTDLKALAELIRQLQSQVHDLSAQLKDVRDQQQSSRDESAELRRELEIAKTQLAALSAQPTNPATPAAASGTEERLSKIEEHQQLEDAKAAEQSQTKVESGSKYRLRLSGVVVMNLFENRGTVDNMDFPAFAEGLGTLGSAGSFGGSLRQSQINLEGFGPDLMGAHTSANLSFDFAGGLPQVPNGVGQGIVRLRTGTIRLDWDNTSLIAGQDYLFFSPLSPTSVAVMAQPPLSYAGNLWSWTPQIRIEHRLALSDSSHLLLQGGILDSFSGDEPYEEYSRAPTWGEQSSQPAYAARIAWTKRAFGQDFTVGAGGYYGRQDWGFSRNIDSWASTADLTLPLGNHVEFSAQFYRGRAVGGLNGGLDESVLWNGSLLDPSVGVHGIDSIGGWTQLKFKLTPKFQINTAVGQDNPFAAELRKYPGAAQYGAYSEYGFLSKNLSPFVNFIYQPRSDLLFSFEYRYLKTFQLDDEPYSAKHYNFTVGYIF